VLAALCVTMSTLGCRSRLAPPPQDASTSCATPTRCEGTAVRACRDGVLAEVLQECAPDAACSLGRCTSSQCARAEADPLGLLGCTFFTFDLDNVDVDDQLGASVLVTNPNQEVAHVALERREAAAWEATARIDVAPMRSARLALPELHLEGRGVASARALRVTSDLPVTAAHVQSDGSGATPVSSSGATMLLPAHVLGRRYRAISYREEVTPRLHETAAEGSHGGAGQIVIVATADGTTVDVTPSSTATFDVSVPDAGAGADADAGPSVSNAPMQLVLDEGDYAQLYGASEGSNLSGTELRANRPIAVFSGNVSTTYGVVATGISSPDLTHEQLLPTRAWGRRFVGVVLPPQAGVCDPLLTPVGSSKLALVADRDDTNVTIRYAPMTVVPKTELAAGAWVEETTPRNFTLTASGPVEVMQGMDCEPTMSSAVPTERLHRDLYFAVLPGFDTTIAIVRREGRATYLDGARLEDSLFEPVGDGFDVLRVPLEECPASESVCTHHVQGEFGITMRGMDVLAAWSLTIPTWMPCDPDAAECL
jgi:hypothetical protein